MSELVHLILGDFWRFLGAAVILAIIFDGLASLVVALRGGTPKSMLQKLGVTPQRD